MGTAFQIRPGTPEDLPFLHDIERAASALFPAGRLPDPDDVMPLEQLRHGCDAGLLWIATLEDRRVGFAMSQLRECDLHLAVMAVHPESGRRGIGAGLLHAVIQQARSKGLRVVTLTTFRDLPFNAPFYSKHGFRILGESELTEATRAALIHEQALGMRERVAMIHSLGS